MNKKNEQKINRKIVLKLIFYTFIIIVIFSDVEVEKRIAKKLLNLFPYNYKYFVCFCSIGKKENLYVRELVEYYVKSGVDKFYFGDNNDINTEKLSDVLQDYINNKTVEIINLIGVKKKRLAIKFYMEMYNTHKSDCNWMMFYDFDEFLDFTDKNMTVKKFLSDEKFDKCDIVKINWLAFNDNDLLYYDNRSMNERFTKPVYNYYLNSFVKPIVRGNLFEPIWKINVNCHSPNHHKAVCNCLGERILGDRAHIRPPIFNVSYIKHFRAKTIEEFAQKTKRGYAENKYDINYYINLFFSINKFSEEKLRIYEKIMNITLPNYHEKPNL